MDRNNIIGIALIFILFLAWQYFLAPSKTQIAAQQRAQDSIARVERLRDSLAIVKKQEAKEKIKAAAEVPDSIRTQMLGGQYGPFANAAVGKEETTILENELIKVTFSNKGGRIQDVLVKRYFKMVQGKDRKDRKIPLHLLDDVKNRFEYTLPVKGLRNGVNTADLYFEVDNTGNSVTFRADAGNGQYFAQTYSLPSNTYKLDYRLDFEGMDQVFEASAKNITLKWVNYLDKIEKATQYERQYSSLNFKAIDENSGRCSPTREYSEKDAEGAPIQWVANTNQFFNSSLLSEKGFTSAKMASKNLPEENEDLKELKSEIQVPFGGESAEQFAMHFYIGPNEFDRLHKMGYSLSDVVPFGQNIMGTINRWVIRPLFSFLTWLISSKGIVILMLTFMVKLLLFPLTYRMIYSQSKMTALKPEIERLKERYGDDQQKVQMETMSMYREFGVNPLGACFPMLLQLPIWFALYRFFPASIEFRQASFLWATDLSSYDEFFQLPFNIPFGFGEHISLFALLWVLSTLLYTWYNSKNMDFSANPSMLYMQYIMPVLFMGFFNSSASGLSAYMLFSNLLNIGQTLATKYFLIDEKKLKLKMDDYRKKPKKKAGFGARMETMLKEQQRLAEEKSKQAKQPQPKRK
ncbi:MAG: membrane protein insertase YidC [Haliscomenobacter sp.]|nr:membrane protein insertase YidC [Haliscomenobacter sp.]MBK9490216.1 membrane protein insertase YidC [Haliscomenobacter sp.]